jgi:hypothetical protein
MQKGATGVRFVTRVGRQRRHSSSTEEMRADGDADRHPCGFDDEIAHGRIAHWFAVDCEPQQVSPCRTSCQDGSVDLQIALD